MDKTQKRTLNIVYKLIRGKEIENKNSFPSKLFVPEELKNSVALERSSPESEGENSSLIDAFFDEIFSHPKTFTQGAVVTKNGKVIAERYKEPFSGDIPHSTFSMCKTVVGMAIGVLVDKGKINYEDKIADLIDLKKYGVNNAGKCADLTVIDLLTMKSGVSYRENGMIGEKNWVKEYFSSKVNKSKTFNYNSMNSFILGVVVKEQSEMTLSEFVFEHLFRPLGIFKFYWEKNAQGLEKGGWGLYLTTQDMAKLGMLILNKGVWQGKRLLSEQYISDMTKCQISVPDFIGDFNYGYQVWTKNDGETLSFNGMFGQNVSVFSKSGIVVALSSGNNDIFFANPTFKILEKYFAYGETDSFEVKKEQNSTLEFEKFSGEFKFNKKGRIASLIPTVIAVMSNSFSSGIQSFDISDCQDGFKLRWSENNEFNELKFSRSSEFVYQTVGYRGDRYQVATNAKNIGGVLELYLHFVESASVKKISISKKGKNTVVTFSENPSVEFVEGAVNMLISAKKGNFTSLLVKIFKPIVLKFARKVFVVKRKFKN